MIAFGFVHVLTLLAVPGPEATACPIPPALSWYVTNADAIVVTRVVGVSIEAPDSELMPEETEEPGDGPEQAESTYEIDVVSAGASNARRLLTATPVRVLKESDGIPDVVELHTFYETGATTDDAALIGALHLVFLDGDAEGGGELSVLESRELPTHELERSYSSLISDWLVIKALGTDEETIDLRIDWAIGCFDEPATRGDALRELYEQAGSWDEVEVLELLSGAQRARLFELLEAVGPSELYIGIGLATLLAPLRDDRVVTFARRAMRDAPEDELYLAITAMELLSGHYGWRTGSALAAMAQDSNSPEVIRGIVDRFEALATDRREDDTLLREIEAVAPADEEVDGDDDRATGTDEST